jgi:hypothetical protein
MTTAFQPCHARFCELVEVELCTIPNQLLSRHEVLRVVHTVGGPLLPSPVPEPAPTIANSVVNRYATDSVASAPRWTR